MASFIDFLSLYNLTEETVFTKD